jgi:hypothetical protein
VDDAGVYLQMDGCTHPDPSIWTHPARCSKPIHTDSSRRHPILSRIKSVAFEDGVHVRLRCHDRGRRPPNSRCCSCPWYSSPLTFYSYNPSFVAGARSPCCNAQVLDLMLSVNSGRHRVHQSRDSFSTLQRFIFLRVPTSLNIPDSLPLPITSRHSLQVEIVFCAVTFYLNTSLAALRISSHYFLVSFQQVLISSCVPQILW